MFIPPMPPRDDRPAGDRCDVTLRDTFAAAALTGLTSRPSWRPDECVLEAYRLADAMLRERLRNGAVSGCETVRSDHIPDFGKMADSSVKTAAAREVPDAWATAYAVTRACEIANHDAAPAAKAPADRYVRRAAAYADKDRTDKAAPRPCDGTGDTPVAGFATTAEPVAWAVMYPNKEFGILAFYRRDAEDLATASDRVVPLYRHSQPTLTDAERRAVDAAARIIDAYEEEMDGFPSGAAATLRGLLERLS